MDLYGQVMKVIGEFDQVVTEFQVIQEAAGQT